MNQADAEALTIGAKARIRVHEFSEIDLPGHIGSIGEFAKMGSYRRGFLSEVPARLKFEKMDPRVISNFSASADVVLEAWENATVVPRECLFDEPGDRKHIAFVLNVDNRERREVEIGLQSDLAAEVISGLRSGEEVASKRAPSEMLAAR